MSGWTALIATDYVKKNPYLMRDLENWCSCNVKGRWAVDQGSINYTLYFEHEDDALLLKMTFPAKPKPPRYLP